jgi:hypothetical protein
MAIVLNLLAEQQHADEIRRRDPVRRTLMGSVLTIGVALSFSLLSWLAAWQAQEDLKSVELRWLRLESENKQLSEALVKSRKVEEDLNALTNLASSRFLWAPLLNAMQDCVIDRVQVSGLRADQASTPVKTETIAPKTREKSKVSKVVTTNMVETIVLHIEANDYSNSQFSRLQDIISSQPYFRRCLQTNGTVRLASLNPPAKSDGENEERNFTHFKIEVAFPPVTRSEARR